MALINEVVKGVSPQEKVKYRTMAVGQEAFEMAVTFAPASLCSHVQTHLQDTGLGSELWGYGGNECVLLSPFWRAVPQPWANFQKEKCSQVGKMTKSPLNIPFPLLGRNISLYVPREMTLREKILASGKVNIFGWGNVATYVQFPK